MFVILRWLLIIGCVIGGGLIAAMLCYYPDARYFSDTPHQFVILLGALCGLGVALISIAGEFLLRRMSLRNLAIIALGLAIGALIAWLVTYPQILLPEYIKEFIQRNTTEFTIFKLSLYVFFVYIGIVIAVRGRNEFSIFVPHFEQARRKYLPPVVIDTSAIIDGRVVEIYKTGFMRNKILLPEFVLHELQIVSDSQVSLTRTKGRRGLETLKLMQENPAIEVEVTNIDYPDVPEVDDKLMCLAKEIHAAILTTDYNLEQVATIQDIQCLNIYGLVNALKTPFIPGEIMNLQIVKEGSESNQGVGFLEDGTMIVVSDARVHIGKRIDVELVSIVQGSSGRIFFGQPAASADDEHGSNDRNKYASNRK